MTHSPNICPRFFLCQASQNRTLCTHLPWTSQNNALYTWILFKSGFTEYKFCFQASYIFCICKLKLNFKIQLKRLASQFLICIHIYIFLIFLFHIYIYIFSFLRIFYGIAVVSKRVDHHMALGSGVRRLYSKTKIGPNIRHERARRNDLHIHFKDGVFFVRCMPNPRRAIIVPHITFADVSVSFGPLFFTNPPPNQSMVVIKSPPPHPPRQPGNLFVAL